MKITNVSYERLDFDLSVPYTIAYETVSKTTNFILKIETDLKDVGYGCAAPDETVTGGNALLVEEAIKSIIIPYLIGKSAYSYAKIITDLSILLANKSSALAMVDIALHDLIARKAELPLYKLLGGYRNSIATSITIGILPLDETLLLASEYIKQGFTILKIKGGLSVEDDIEKMNQLRVKFPKIKLRFDGNQGYSVEESISFARATEKIEFFEQPTKVEYEDRLKQVKSKVNIPVMADESLKTLEDAFRLAQNQKIDMLNIKLMKVGGILEASHINSVAKSANIKVMIGCIDECGLGISAGLHFALSRPNIQYADLDGNLEILDDPFKSLFRLEKGILYPSDEIGLGKINS